MEISVIIVVYNEETYLRQALDSLLDQSFDHSRYEIVIVDNGSTDGTAQIIASYHDGRIRVVRLDENRGIPVAYNVGLKEAVGRYVVRVDSDDYVHHEFLTVGHLCLSLNADFDAMAFDYFLVDAEGLVTDKKEASREPIACATMYKRPDLIDIGSYDESFRLRAGVELRRQFLQRGYKILQVPLPLYSYRRHDRNLTLDSDAVRYYGRLIEEKYGPAPSQT